MRVTGGCGRILGRSGCRHQGCSAPCVRSAPVLTDAGVGVGVAVLVLAASAAGVGPRGSSALVHSTPWRSGWSGLWLVPWRRRYPISVLVVLNAVALAWAAAQYPGRLILLAPLIACYTLAALQGWRWGLAGTVVTALSALVAIRVAFGAAEPAGISGIAVWMAATAGAAGTAVGYYRAPPPAPSLPARPRPARSRPAAAQSRNGCASPASSTTSSATPWPPSACRPGWHPPAANATRPGG